MANWKRWSTKYIVFPRNEDFNISKEEEKIKKKKDNNDSMCIQNSEDKLYVGCSSGDTEEKRKQTNKTSWLF